MTRQETTKFLSDLLESRLASMNNCYAKEVTLDCGSVNVKRVDYMQFEPAGVASVSAIEKGIFTCYEVKSCKEDVYSGNGLNFVGEKNYIVTTMECYKNLQQDMRDGKLDEHIRKCSPNSSLHYGIMVAIPEYSNVYDEYDNPTKLDKDTGWKLAVAYNCHTGLRKRSMTELLFCMLRSGK